MDQVSKVKQFLQISQKASPTVTLNLEDLYDLGVGRTSELNGNGTGFYNITQALNGKDADNLPDFRYWYRQADYKIEPDDQRDGWNYARIVHSISGSPDRETNYVEWINDSEGQNNNIAISNILYSNFWKQ